LWAAMVGAARTGGGNLGAAGQGAVLNRSHAVNSRLTADGAGDHSTSSSATSISHAHQTVGRVEAA